MEISSFYFTRLQIGEVASQKHTIKKCTYRAKIETQSWSSHMKATPYLGKLHPFCIIWSGSRDVTFYTPGKLMYVAEYKRAMHSVPSSNLTCLSDCLFKTCQLFPRQWKKKKQTVTFPAGHRKWNYLLMPSSVYDLAERTVKKQPPNALWTWKLQALNLAIRGTDLSIWARFLSTSISPHTGKERPRILLKQTQNTTCKLFFLLINIKIPWKDTVILAQCGFLQLFYRSSRI